MSMQGQRTRRGALLVLLSVASSCGPESIVLEHAGGAESHSDEDAGIMPAAGTGGSSADSGNPETGGGSAAGGGAAVSGGTGATGGSGDAGISAGGSGGRANGAGGAVGGSAGTATPGTGGTSLVVNCGNSTDYATALRNNCANAGCHRAGSPPSGLDLTPDAGLVSRLKDGPAKFGDIICGDVVCPVPPASCPVPGSVLLVDSVNPDASWMLTKMGNGTLDCGDPMPGTAYEGPDDQACIENLIEAIAALPE
jgi:hypothetical protein